MSMYVDILVTFVLSKFQITVKTLKTYFRFVRMNPEVSGRLVLSNTANRIDYLKIISQNFEFYSTYWFNSFVSLRE